MKKMKWFIPVMAAMLFVAVVVPGTTEGGKKWSGIDPIFLVNGDQFNVWIEWPEGYGCSITEPIEIDLMVPKSTSYVFMSESSDDVDGCGFPQLTETKAKFTGSNGKVKFVAKVDSEEDFPVRMKVYFKGELVRTYEGDSNEGVTGKPSSESTLATVR